MSDTKGHQRMGEYLGKWQEGHDGKPYFWKIRKLSRDEMTDQEHEHTDNCFVVEEAPPNFRGKTHSVYCKIDGETMQADGFDDFAQADAYKGDY